MTQPRHGMALRGAHAAVRLLAQQAFSRVAGAPLIPGNEIRLLIDAQANFDAWLLAIRGAERSVLFENYMFSDDAAGREIRAALVERAQAGAQVRAIRDWFGCLGASSDGRWKRLRAAGGAGR